MKVGEEWVVRVESLTKSASIPCDWDRLGFAVGTELTLRAEEQREVSLGDAICFRSTGSVSVDNGWTYQLSSRPVQGKDTFQSQLDASRGSCSGSIYLGVGAGGDALPAEVVFQYISRAGGEDCPTSCEGVLRGTMVSTEG